MCGRVCGILSLFSSSIYAACTNFFAIIWPLVASHADYTCILLVLTTVWHLFICLFVCLFVCLLVPHLPWVAQGTLHYSQTFLVWRKIHKIASDASAWVLLKDTLFLPHKLRHQNQRIPWSHHVYGGLLLPWMWWSRPYVGRHKLVPILIHYYYILDRYTF